MEWWLEVRTPAGDRHEVAVDLGPSTTVAQLVDALADHVRVDGPHRLWVPRLDRRLPDASLVGRSGLRFGDRVELVAPTATTRATPPVATLDVIAGAAAGARFLLAPGDHSVGRDEGRTITIADPSISTTHAGIRVEPDRIMIADAGSSNGTFVNGRRLTSPLEVHLGDTIEMGHTTMRLDPPGARNTDQPVGDDGLVHFNRPPRVHRPPGERLFKLSAAPNQPDRRRIPLASALGPLLLGVPMIAIGATTGNATVLITGAASAVLSPLLAVASFLEDRRSGRRRHGDELASFRAKLEATSAQMEKALDEELEERRLQAPDMAEMVERVRTLAPTLWERRPTFGDFLHCRVGIADQPSLSAYELPDGSDDRTRAEVAAELDQWCTVRGAPVVVDIVDAGVVGLCGNTDVTAAIARTLLVHTAIAQSPRDVVVAVAVSAAERDAWSWVTWLPHVRSDVSPLTGSHFAVGEAEATALFENVSAVVTARRAERSGRLSSSARPTPAVVLFVSEELRVPRTAITAILEDGSGVAVHVVWLGRSPEGLPGECGAVVEVSDRPVSLTLTRPNTGQRLERVVADLVPEDVARAVALALAGLRDVTAGGARAQIPRRVSLIELLDLTELSPSRIVQRWQRASDGVDALVGCSAGGPFRLDMRADGPHALVGGTTGAGKSELLQTFVAALAATHPPDRVTFLLVDYKGGAAFKDAVSLPHTVGFVTDLDGHLVSRVLVSLNAELHRREHLLRDHGAKDLLEMERRHPETAPPSLLLIVDEFATLAKELPEFVDGVVNVAQRGRSLGIHLVLATQRPAGAINDNVRANTNLRIALRMNDTTDSEDVIAAKDAAMLPRTLPGRAYARTGQAELTEVQIAYVGGHTVLGAASSDEIVVSPLVAGVASRAPRQAHASDEQRTDLQLLVEAIDQAAHDAGIARQPQPWLPPLPPVLALESLPPAPEGSAVLGLVDLPARQAQEPWLWDPEAEGALLVYGTSGAGKTTALRTIATSMAISSSPDQVNIYGLDFASRGLAPLEALPHVGAVIVGEDVERVQRLMDTLGREITRRRDAFAAVGASTLSEHRNSTGDVLPRIVVLLDGYAGFTSVFERIDFGAWIERLPRLVSDGRALGIHFVITADRRSAVNLALSGTITSKVVLRMADDDEYSSLGLDARVARSTALPPGRGFVGPTIEMHVATVGGDATGEAEADPLAAIGAEMRRQHSAAAPPIRSLPLDVASADMPVPARLCAMLGIGHRELEPLAVDLRDGNLLVVGPNRSGRSSALATLARSLDASTPDAELYLLAPRRSPLVDLDIWTRVARGVSDCTDLARELEEVLDERSGSEAPLVVVVDDGTELVDTMADTSLERLARRGRDAGISLIGAAESTAALRAYSGWIPEIRKDRRALLLNPDPDLDGDLVSVKLPRRTGGGMPPGRGYLAIDGAVELVQCAG